jgi:hypothetical protein
MGALGRRPMNEQPRPTYPKWVILLSKVLSRAAAILYVGLILAGVGLHVWTVSMAYHVEGIGLPFWRFCFRSEQNSSGRSRRGARSDSQTYTRSLSSSMAYSVY